MKTLSVILLITLSLFADVIIPEKGIYQISTSRVLKTSNRKASAETIITTVETAGGWLITDREESISLRVPSGTLDSLLIRIDSLGIVTDRSFSRTDRTDECLRLLASLEAKETLLEQYLSLLDSSGTEGIYPVSREIANLQESIEHLKGQLNGMYKRMEYAEITIYFRFHDRRQPLTAGYSVFQWLNTVNLPSLINDFR